MIVRWQVSEPLDVLFEKKGKVMCAGGAGLRSTQVKFIRRVLRDLERSGVYSSVAVRIKPLKKKRRKE